MSDFDSVITGRIVFKDQILDSGYIGISNGNIALIGQGVPPQAKEKFDFDGHWIIPGAIDGQVHSGSQANQEGLGRASRAAAAGGITTMVDMPYDDTRQIIDKASLTQKIGEVESDCHVDVALYATIKNWAGLDAIPELLETGACAFKFSTFEAHPQRFPRVEEDLLQELFQRLAPVGILCGVHNQNQEFSLKNIKHAIEVGDTAWDAWGRAMSPMIENLATVSVYELGAVTGARSHVVHCSLGRGVDICDMYRHAGHRATVEICVHHLTLNDEEHMRRFGAKAKWYPPLRPQAEVESLWKHIAAGKVDFVSSDHVAWGLERKSDPNIFKNSSGGPGLETLVPAVWTGCEQRALSPAIAVSLLCEGPSKAFRLNDRIGSLDIGKEANITVLEPGEFIYDPSTSLSAVSWSAFEGCKFSVRVKATFLRGAMVWNGNSIVNQAGSGRFLPPHKNNIQ